MEERTGKSDDTSGVGVGGDVREQQRRDGIVAERAHDAGEEVRQGLVERGAVLQQYEGVEQRVAERELEILPQRRAGVVLAVVILGAGVVVQPPLRVAALVGRQPARVGRVVEHEDERNRGDEYSHDAFDNEEPAP